MIAGKDFIQFINRLDPNLREGAFAHWPMSIHGSFDEKPPALKFLLPGMISGSVGALVAPGGAGKSMLALQMATWLVTGADTLGLGPATVTNAAVAYLTAEDPLLVLAHRLHALGQQLSTRQQELLAENLFLMPLEGFRPNIGCNSWLSALESLAGESDLLILDTLRRFHDADENSSSEMSEIISRLEAITARTGCSVLFIHHVNKGSTQTFGTDQQQAIRGSSVLSDNVRWQAYLAPMTGKEAESFRINEQNRTKYVRFGLSKCNYSAGLPSENWLIRSEGGVLLPTALHRNTVPMRRPRRASI
ncbi:helicase RepA family protein [Marinobacter sp.]|uniref:helicase RepA family protein n=1 Tax=Marinobacter sp. TaxID=50741 RepID=UPI0025C42060|nr:helicase RepA family protein [Marinobacter sp.]